MQRMSSPMTVDFSICIPTRYVRVVWPRRQKPSMLFRLESVNIRTKSFRCLVIAKAVDLLELPVGACLVQVDALPVVGDTGLNKFMSYISKRRRIHATFVVHDAHGEWTPPRTGARSRSWETHQTALTASREMTFPASASSVDSTSACAAT